MVSNRNLHLKQNHLPEISKTGTGGQCFYIFFTAVSSNRSIYFYQDQDASVQNILKNYGNTLGRMKVIKN